MIDAHLLLNLGRPQGEGLLLGAPGIAPGGAERGQQFAEALRQVHAAGRQELAAAPMQLRIIGSALRVVTPARNLELEQPGEGIAASLAVPVPVSPGRGGEAEGAELSLEIDASASMASTVDDARTLEQGELAPPDQAPASPQAVANAPVAMPVDASKEGKPFVAAPAAASASTASAAPASPQAVAYAPVAMPNDAPEEGKPFVAAPAPAPAPAPASTASTASTGRVQADAPVEPTLGGHRSEGAFVGPADRVAASPKGLLAPRAPLEGAELRDAKAPQHTDRSAPVAVGAVALGLREALKDEARPTRDLQSQRVEAAVRPQRSAVQADSGWALKQNLGAQARAFDRPAAHRTATTPSAPSGADSARIIDGLSSPLLAGADRRELDLVALARPTPGVEGEPAELSEKFATQLAQRVVAQAAAGQLTSRIALNPAQLGPLEIRLELSGERIAVEFQAHHAMTRELLGDGLGRLREGLEQAGFEVTRLATEGRGAGGSAFAGQQGSAFAQSGHAGGQASQGNGQPGVLGEKGSEDPSAPAGPSREKMPGEPGKDAGLDITV